MDRHSSWSGSPGGGLAGAGGAGRGRRVPPRAGQQRRRGAPRAAQWDGARRWWLVALGTLAIALVLPRLAWGQGLRSATATVSLTAIAPPHLRAGASGVRLGASVADMTLPLPTTSGELDRIETRLEGSPLPDASLYVRTVSGGLVPVTQLWSRIPLGTMASFRAVAAGGAFLPAGTWRVRFRLTPRDTTRAPIDVTSDVVVPVTR